MSPARSPETRAPLRVLASGGEQVLEELQVNLKPFRLVSMRVPVRWRRPVVTLWDTPALAACLDFRRRPDDVRSVCTSVTQWNLIKIRTNNTSSSATFKFLPHNRYTIIHVHLGELLSHTKYKQIHKIHTHTYTRSRVNTFPCRATSRRGWIDKQTDRLTDR